MDSSIKFLEIKRLIKELDFLESDYEYQKEILSLKEVEFTNSIQSIVENNPELKKISDSRLDIDLNKSTSSEINEDGNIIKIDNKTKSIYREIVKITHPDKVINQKLNEVYLDATKAYESQDIIEIYKIAFYLDLKLEWNQEEIDILLDKIKLIRNRIEYLKSTWAYRWTLSDDKNKIIVDYIKDNYLRYISSSKVES